MGKDKIIPGLGLTETEFKNIEDFRKSKNSAVLTIMFTDIQGFTALTEERGESYVHKLHSEHDKIIVECVEKDGCGIVIKYIGDSVMAVFSEPTAAVERALEIQKRLRDFNREHPDLENIAVRIGIHMGQTVVENKMHVDLFGRHVNKASRIEGLAEGGHIYISYPVFDSVKSWLTESEFAAYTYHGQYRLKGIEKPEDIYEVHAADGIKPRKPANARRVGHHPWYQVLGAAALVFALLAVFVIFRSPPTVSDSTAETVSPEAVPNETADTGTQQQTPDTTETPATDTSDTPAKPSGEKPAAKIPEVFFTYLNALEPILDLKTPLVLVQVEGTDNTKKSLMPIKPGRHVIHYVVSDIVYYFYEFDVVPGQNFLTAKFVRSELPGVQINLFLKNDGQLEKTRNVTKKYFYYTRNALEKVSRTGSIEASVSGVSVSPEMTRFTINYSLNLDGTEIARDTLVVESPMNSSESTRSDPIVIHEDPYHKYEVRYSIRNDSIQVNIDASFKDFS